MQTYKLDYRIVTDGLDFPEGPIVLADGSVLVVEI
jgi:gluconolactonase